ncbi:MAG: diadenylate cyclase [Candidatus Aenigmarchaeota archaeon]|nr:diadenylate cyclase [Candidatus Aenigmarchaeota archaeon]
MKDYKTALEGKDRQIYESMEDYRSWKRSPAGLLVTSGPIQTIMDISTEVKKNGSPFGKLLKGFFEKNRERQLIFDERYDGSVGELYDMLSHTDGAANFDNGYLTAIKRYIEGVIRTGEDIEGGARHLAAAYASTKGLKSYVLSEERGNITVFLDGRAALKSPGHEIRDSCDSQGKPVLNPDYLMLEV